MRKIVTLAAAAALAALMALAPAAIARHSHASCTRADRNHDSIPDKWECKNRLSLRVKQTRRDPDHDGLNNLQEFRDGTNPRRADTDGDGIRDGAEMRRGLNPRSQDSDRDGVNDENELAGTVVSFDQGTDNDPSTGTLTIQPAGGGDPVSGQVTSATRIECERADQFENEDAQPTTTARASRDGSGDQPESGDDHSGDNSGPGSVNSGPGSTTGGGDDNAAENDNEGGCTTADLTPNAMVHEAKLENGTFTKVELVK
jgi:hypothetical protein